MCALPLVDDFKLNIKPWNLYNIFLIHWLPRLTEIMADSNGYDTIKSGSDLPSRDVLYMAYCRVP